MSPAYDHVAYAALCDAGVHLTPQSAKQSHDFEREQVYVGPYPSVPALLLIWTADFGDVDHTVRAKAIMDSGGSRSRVSHEADHAFRLIAMGQ